MSDDRVRLHVEASVVSVSSSLVFLEILYRRCVLAPVLPTNFQRKLLKEGQFVAKSC